MFFFDLPVLLCRGVVVIICINWTDWQFEFPATAGKEALISRLVSKQESFVLIFEISVLLCVALALFIVNLAFFVNFLTK